MAAYRVARRFWPTIVSVAAATLIVTQGGIASAQLDQPPPTSTTPAVVPASAPATPKVPVKRAPPPRVKAAVDAETPPTPVVRRAPRAPARSGSEPVVRAKAGNFGMFFRFGGLATLTQSNNTRAVNAVLITHAGFKSVISETWMIPFYFGTGMRVTDPPDPAFGGTASSKTDWGFDAGIGFEYHYRIWGRISPYVGLNFGIGLSDPTGENNVVYGFGIGPVFGVETYIADRISISAMYMFNVQIEVQSVRLSSTRNGTQTSFQFNTAAGGAANLTYYY